MVFGPIPPLPTGYAVSQREAELVRWPLPQSDSSGGIQTSRYDFNRFPIPTKFYILGSGRIADNGNAGRSMGVEYSGPCDGIIERMEGPNEETEYLEQHRSKVNALMSQEIQVQRVKRGIWTPRSEPRKTRIYIPRGRPKIPNPKKIPRGRPKNARILRRFPWALYNSWFLETSPCLDLVKAGFGFLCERPLPSYPPQAPSQSSNSCFATRRSRRG